jgi:hypothetical protein
MTAPRQGDQPTANAAGISVEGGRSSARVLSASPAERLRLADGDRLGRHLRRLRRLLVFLVSTDGNHSILNADLVRKGSLSRSPLIS